MKAEPSRQIPERLATRLQLVSMLVVFFTQLICQKCRTAVLCLQRNFENTKFCRVNRVEYLKNSIFGKQRSRKFIKLLQNNCLTFFRIIEPHAKLLHNCHYNLCISLKKTNYHFFGSIRDSSIKTVWAKLIILLLIEKFNNKEAKNHWRFAML